MSEWPLPTREVLERTETSAASASVTSLSLLLVARFLFIVQDDTTSFSMKYLSKDESRRTHEETCLDLSSRTNWKNEGICHLKMATKRDSTG